MDSPMYLSQTVACAWCDGPCETEDDPKIWMFTVPELPDMERLAFCTLLHGEMHFCEQAVREQLEISVEVIALTEIVEQWCPVKVTGRLNYTENANIYQVDGVDSHIVFPSRRIIGHKYNEFARRHILMISLSGMYHSYEV